MPLHRSSKAPLSSQEIDTLRRLGGDAGHPISSSHRFLLLSMGLIVIASDGLRLTEEGRDRLAMEEGVDPVQGGRPAGHTLH